MDSRPKGVRERADQNRMDAERKVADFCQDWNRNLDVKVKGWVCQWQPIESDNPPEFQTVLTQHKDDLFPVPAYRVEGDLWHRETEGPEDAFYGAERHCPLYRAPTHYQPLPAPPEEA